MKNFSPTRTYHNLSSSFILVLPAYLTLIAMLFHFDCQALSLWLPGSFTLVARLFHFGCQALSLWFFNPPP
jgi:hypothetical protein